MTGRPQFEQVVAQAPRQYLSLLDLTTTGQVAPGETEIIDIYSPANTISSVNNLFLRTLAEGGAASGTHFTAVSTPAAAGSYVFGQSDYATAVTFDSCSWNNANVVSQPKAGDIAQAVANIRFDDVAGLRFIYKNDLNITTNQARERYIIVTRNETAD